MRTRTGTSTKSSDAGSEIGPDKPASRVKDAALAMYFLLTRSARTGREPGAGAAAGSNVTSTPHGMAF